MAEPINLQEKRIAAISISTTDFESKTSYQGQHHEPIGCWVWEREHHATRHQQDRLWPDAQIAQEVARKDARIEL